MAQTSPTPHRTGPSNGVRILAILAYTGFAIPVSIVAMTQFGILGLLLAGGLGWQWSRIAGLTGGPDMSRMVEELRPESPTAEPKSSGNSSFDAYRASLMERLEQEQESFEGFLTRLRAAKDKAEFDDFLDARARRQIEHQTQTPEPSAS